MKKLINITAFIGFVIIFISCSLENNTNQTIGSYFYRFDPTYDKVPIEYIENTFVVYIDSTKITREQLKKKHNIIKESSREDSETLCFHFQENNNNYTKTVNRLKSLDYVVDVEPIIKGTGLDVSRFIYIELTQPNDSILLKHICDSLNIKITDRSKDFYYGDLLTGPGTVLQVDKNTKCFNAINAANILFETGTIRLYKLYYAIIEGSVWCGGESNQPQFSDWNLKAINADKAWKITTGNNNITIAILDSGVDTLIQEFSECNILPGYDAVENKELHNKYTADHGTSVASIIFSKHDNKGISGIAPQTKILPILVGDKAKDSLTLESLARGIDYAVNHGADIINCSLDSRFKFNTTTHSQLENALDNAFHNGRNGKGCIVIFAAGNDCELSEISYPQGGKSDILVVSQCDSNFKWSASTHGKNLGITAPGENVCVALPHTDVSNHRIQTNSGTSFATPHVAGVAALMLSVNPNLTRQQVCDIIEQTATKIDSIAHPYLTDASHPNGTWNEFLGYGLIDAYAAVAAARDSLYADLHIRDCEGDSLGIEPGNSIVYWNSPDICLLDKETNDEILTLSAYDKDTCLVAVNILNRSDRPSGALNEKLYLTWQRTSLTAKEQPLNSHAYPAQYGRLMPSIGEPIGALQPHERRVTTPIFEFALPNMPLLQGTINNAFPTIDTIEASHCLGWGFSIMAAANEGYGLLPEIQPNQLNLPSSALAKKYNSVAVSNTNRLISDKIYGQIIEVCPSNGNTFALTLSQIVRNGQYKLTDFAEVYALLSTDLMALLQNSEDLEVVDENRIRIDNIGTELLFDAPQQPGNYFVGIEVHFRSDLLPELNDFDIDIALSTDGATDEVMRFTALRNPDLFFQAHATASSERVVRTDTQVTLTSNLHAEDATYSWYVDDEEIGVGQSINVMPATSTSYVLRVEQTDNGYIAYDTINIQVVGGAILDITPNPATTQTDVAYTLSPDCRHAYIYVTNVNGTSHLTIPITEIDELGNGSIMLPLSTLPAGIYFIQLVAEGIVVDTQNLVKL